jgi:hypothetical protein
MSRSWGQVLPTVVWLLAAGFAVGALLGLR